MKEFLLVFRAHSNGIQPSPEQMQESMKQWQNWLGSIAAKDKLVSSGNRLASEGKVVKPDSVVTNGPYVEMAEAIGGYSIIKAGSLEEAAEISKGCPILFINGSVEVRAIVPMDNNS